ncbi:Histidine--tRNA ligase [Thermosinus carboxydivorans Nor1]|uniref:ATP phosphoribosyltransferase regulatory subunit n=1 Tax=Thermosinus carboxydivorans Nor1 TaxID=401526 RepID=A1HMH3_9FIRM|nr:ATP phosphoribosyltransferase regulatory subunit [Thermosinus carboxydivorans]EAX49013.1 Histidine--tRNA ligase [Thermosinus carboxydivorans Nor1]
MSQNEFVPQIPYGTRDFLPRDAKKKRLVESALAGLFTRWGYDEVITPTFEYLDILSVGADQELVQHMFKFLDKNNRLLALRPDMTTPIARVAATRLREQPAPLRLFYLTNVFRYEQAQAGRQCEFYQAGVELMGMAGPAADAEVVALAAAAMREAGLTVFQISLGQVEFINGLMNECELPQAERQRIKNCLVQRDLVGLDEALAASSLSPAGQVLFKRIPLLHGRENMLDAAYGMVSNDMSRRALDNLAEIYRLLEYYGVSGHVSFDLGIIRNFDYYTGAVFEGYTPGLGFPLCGGGRYDGMVGAFGVEYPATGFALGIERLMLALERQGLTPDGNAKDVYIGWAPGRLNEAIALAGELRAAGRIVGLGLQPQDKAAAEACRQAMGYANLIYVGG